MVPPDGIVNTIGEQYANKWIRTNPIRQNESKAMNKDPDRKINKEIINDFFIDVYVCLIEKIRSHMSAIVTKKLT